MPDLYPIQESMAYGEISPRLWNRPSTDRVQQAVAYALNMSPLSHGPVRMRAGSRYIAKIDETDHDLMLVPFQFSAVQAGVLVIGENWLQVFDERGPVTHTPSGIELITNGTFTTGIGGWGEIAGQQSGMQWDADNLAMQLFSGGTQAGRTAEGWQLVTLENTTGVAHDLVWDMYVIDDPGGVSPTFGEVRVGTTLGASDIALATLQPGTGLGLTVTPGAGVTQVYVSFFLSNNAATVNIDNVSMKEQGADSELARFPSAWAGFTRQLIQWEALPNADITWLVHPNVEPQFLAFDGKTFTTGPLVFGGKPANWTGTNWPATITFHQQRGWFAGAPDKPEDINGSKTGDYADLTTGTQPTDGLQYTLARRGRISWMKGARTLVVGTETAEYIAESSGPALIPGDIEFRQQSAYGSLAGQAENIGDRVIYASGDETKLRTMAYEWTKDAWISVDLAWPAEHLTRRRIERVVYAGDPETLLLATERSTPFNINVCSYNREQNIIGWSRAETDGEYHGIAVTTWAGTSRLWTAVRRELDAGSSIYLEQWGDRYSLDSWLESIAVAPTTTFSGFDHLEGKEVGVIIIGPNSNLATHPPVTVTGGAITLQYPANHVIVGLPFNAVLLTLPLASQNQALVNVASRRKRWNKIYLRLAASVKPVAAGVDFFETYQQLLDGVAPSALTPLPARSERYPAVPMGLGQPDRYEDVQIAGLGWDTAHAVLVVQDTPLPTTIVGIFGEMGVGAVDGREE